MATLTPHHRANAKSSAKGKNPKSRTVGRLFEIASVKTENMTRPNLQLQRIDLAQYRHVAGIGVLTNPTVSKCDPIEAAISFLRERKAFAEAVYLADTQERIFYVVLKEDNIDNRIKFNGINRKIQAITPFEGERLSIVFLSPELLPKFQYERKIEL